MWERWGKQHASEAEIAEREARDAEMRAVHTAAVAELTALVEAARPAAIAAWADAHDALLAAFLADTTDATAKHVAGTEREQWGAVKRGELAFVDENVFYVKLDRARYLELFGIEP
jgi:hypothetical protein